MSEAGEAIAGDTAPAVPPPVLALEHVAKRREQAGARFELDVPAFNVAAGEFVAVVGESGCGKSTLLDLLGLISRPTAAGNYRMAVAGGASYDIASLWRIGDEPMLAGIRRRHLGYVLQTGGLLPFLSVRENLLLPMRLNRLAGGRERVVAMSRRFGIVDCLSRLPESLSGGQRQRVAILRALVHAPDIVLADEPTAAVDRARARQIVKDFSALAKHERLAIIMVTHDLDLVGDVADSTYGFEVRQLGENHTLSTCRRETGP
jgi:putative ABC transport system ATP-binding protein